MPMTSATPAPWEETSPLEDGLRRVCVVVAEVISGSRISMILSTDSCACPNSPTSESRAIRPGKIASTE